MAQVQANTKQAAAAPAAKRGRAKKGDEQFKLEFVDSEDKLHNRVAAGTKSIKVTDKAGKNVIVTIDSLPDAVKIQLAFTGLGTLLKSPLKKDATNVLDTVAKTVKSITEGNLFASTGKKAGRVFDAGFWVECFAYAMELAVEKKVPNAKKVSEEGKKKLHAMLEGSTVQERGVKTKQWMTNPIFVYAKKEVEARRAKKVVGEKTGLEGLEF